MLPVHASNRMGTDLRSRVRLWPQHRPGQDPARERVEQFRPVDRETGPLNGCGGVSAQVASGIRRDHSGVRRSCQRARLPQPCAGRLSRRRRPWLNRGPGHGCVLGRRQASPRTITPTAANTASSGWNPIHASSAASKHTSPAPAAIDSSRAHRWPRHCYHPASRKSPPTSPTSSTPGTRQSLNGVPASTPGPPAAATHPGRPPTAHPRPGPQPRSPAPTRPAPADLHRAPARRRAGPPGHVRQPAQHRSYPDTAGGC